MDSAKYLYFFHDATRAFKNLKDGMLNNVTVTIPDKYVELYNLQSKVASSKHFEELLTAQKDLLDLKLTPKLKTDYLNIKKHFQKMRVKSASHILSHEVSAALRFIGEENNKPKYEATSWLVQRFAKWFKILTSRNLAFALSKKKRKQV